MPPRQPCGCIPMRLFTYLQFYGAIDMYDKSMIAQLLPSEMIIKNYIHGDPDCNYERYLLEFVNASDFFRTKSGGDIYQSPESEENGQCDCIPTSYQLEEYNMYLSTITLKNFRKYAYDGVSKHGITVNFHKGLNALIGENDSGKSAIIDAIKLVLQTQSGEFTRVTDEDFYISATGEIATEFSIDCTFES